ncbi:MAG: ABC transporter permease [Acidobacteriota bacterium]|nr:ABC transporter permease [Acidobacteriota bacterium]
MVDEIGPQIAPKLPGFVMPVWNTLRHTLRQLRKSPAFTITVIATLALCIGANTAIYTVVDAMFFRPLPYPHPESLVMLSTVYSKGGAFDVDTSQDGHQWELVRDHASLLEAAVAGSGNGLNLVSGGRVEYVQNQRVSANFFHVLGLTPLLGREFSRAEDVPNGPALAILSYSLWQRVFHGDPGVLGRSIDLRGAPYTVIGIGRPAFRTVPLGFGSDIPPDVWTPLQPSRSGEGGGDNYGVIARLKAGVTIAQANGQLNSIVSEMVSGRHLPSGMSVEERAIPLQAGITYDLRSRVDLMWGAVVLVLLIGCVNIAGILLTRSAARSREFATRLALGASRSRIILELLVEAILLAFAGGVMGVIFGEFALEGLLWLSPGEFTLMGPVQLNLHVMALMMAVSLATSIVFGLFPAFEASSVDLRSALVEGGRSNAGSRRQWRRQCLVFAEVALGVVLVVAAGLLIRTFMIVANAPPGFDARHLMIASASLQDARYATSAAGARLFRESVQRIEQIPGVQSAAVALSSPYSRPLNEPLTEANGRPVRGITELTYATPGMFETLRMRVLHGRVFTNADSANNAPVAVVNEAFLRRYIHGTADPISTSIKVGGGSLRIVGVVNNVQETNGIGLGGPIDQFPEVYVPVEQFTNGSFAMANTWFSPVWLVRTYGDVPRLEQDMQRALAAVDPLLPFSSFKTMPEVRGHALQQQRYQAAIFSVFAGLTILIAALGIYGLVAQSVAQRTREMGIRLALGATMQGVIRTAAFPGIALSAAGIAVGSVLALFVTRLLKGLIWNVAPTDPTTFVLTAALLIAVAALASVIPALRLAHVDPASILHDE